MISNRYVYNRYESGEKEYYNLRKDPHELNNRARNLDRAGKRRLDVFRRALKDCDGAGCRVAENLGIAVYVFPDAHCSPARQGSRQHDVAVAVLCKLTDCAYRMWKQAEAPDASCSRCRYRTPTRYSLRSSTGSIHSSGALQK